MARTVRTLLYGVTLLVAMLSASVAWCSDIVISNVRLGTPDAETQSVPITFTISWNNSWRSQSGTGNWDASWVFIKFRLSGGAWRHAALSNVGHTLPSNTSAALGVADTGLPYDRISNPVNGVFVYRSSDGTGSFTAQDVTLVWDYGVANITTSQPIDIQVFGVEMVYVPQGSFFVGDHATAMSALQQGSADSDPWFISSENSLAVTQSVGDGAGNGQNGALYYYPGAPSAGSDPSGSVFTVPASFPKGFDGFYVMKGEMSQRQWVDFFNTLTLSQKGARDITTSAAGGKNSDALVYRNNVSWASGDALLPNQGSGATFAGVGMNFVSWSDLAAYLDWASLRPMSELEFEKAARGPLPALAGEYAWGTTVSILASSISNAGLPSERGTIGSNLNADNALGTLGPLRVGSFGLGVTGRADAGAGYHGVFDLSHGVFTVV